jgi:hypothetical protein
MAAAVTYLPTQAAEFSGPGKKAVVIYTPGWTDLLLALLHRKPAGYEAAWSFDRINRAHLLQITYEGGPSLQIGFVDGVHNALFAQLVRGSALALSPHPLYRDEQGGPGSAPLFSPEESLLLPTLPSPIAADSV